MKNSSQSILTKMMVVTGSEHDHIVIRNVWCGSAYLVIHYITFGKENIKLQI